MVLEPIEAHIMNPAALLLLALSLVLAAIPALLVYPVVLAFFWFAIALLCRSYMFRRRAKFHTANRGVT